MAYRVTTQENWWLLAVSGVIAILFGLFALLWPGITLFLLILFFGVYVIVAGIVELVDMFRAISTHRVWWTHLILGLLGIGAGIVVFVWPGITTFVLLWVIAIWALAAGVIEIVAAFSTGQFLYFVSGLISILFGFILLANPAAGALALVMVIGIFAIIRGIILIIGAFKSPAVATPS
ncbi:MAG: HdeD family acid-resistance protein [Chloroflexi bacterium]|nr:HdeD family acid-resistance protein [Chloroflexota bacterium]